MTTPARRTPPTLTKRPAGVVAAEVVDQQDMLTAAGIPWPASDKVDAPEGYGWAEEFASFESSAVSEPVVAGYACPTCGQRYLNADVTCPELGEHPAQLVQAVTAP